LPILPEHLDRLVSRFAGSSASLSDIRDVTLCLVGFAGFLRFNEICNIKWCYISFEDAYFSYPEVRRISFMTVPRLLSPRLVIRLALITCSVDMRRQRAQTCHLVVLFSLVSFFTVPPIHIPCVQVRSYHILGTIV